ncbi:MAG: hypothetical protein M3145_14170, partial [Pseudomonadota bacterium]|nr:hypothetical protein [Pseudomonadota bacterium]
MGGDAVRAAASGGQVEPALRPDPAATAVRSLKRGLRRAERRRKLAAAALVAPLLLFTLLVFIVPLADMLRRSVWDTELAQAWPRVSAALRQSGALEQGGVPNEPVFAALAQDLKSSFEARTAAIAARRLNYDLENGRSLVLNTA